MRLWASRSLKKVVFFPQNLGALLRCADTCYMFYIYPEHCISWIAKQRENSRVEPGEDSKEEV